ncbi:MAG: flavodoxin [Intestinibacter sp.]
MKKILLITAILLVTFSLVACNQITNNDSSQNDSSTVANSTDQSSGNTSENKVNSSGSNVLIAYFTLPEAVDDDSDTVSSASIVKTEDRVVGSTEYIAKMIQNSIGGTLFEIETEKQYSKEHDSLVDDAAKEQEENARPELSSKVKNMDSYDIIFIGYPIWWGDLPMPLYTFLEEYDLSGKTIVPFCTHGGSRLSNTDNTIADLQKDATVVHDALVISRSDVAVTEQEEVDRWLESMNLK